jgi:DNA-binding CsgD family transcriptional regulator/tetratricopeptide (TPR) repeat protein
MRRVSTVRSASGVSEAGVAGAIVGRDAELASLERWLGTSRPALLQLEGEAGIGKTVLWDEGVRVAREAGALVLACRPAEVETVVAYGALASLLEPALAIASGAVPPPRRRALKGALRLIDVPASRLDETAVALGALSVLRAVAERQPVVVAVDDVQWLDASSRVALTYALRNLQPGDDVLVLLTRRLDAEQRLELGGSAVGLSGATLQPGPLSVGALHRIIRERLDTVLSRPKLVHVHAASRGNPFYAIELARIVAGTETSSRTLAVPPSLGDALRTRIGGLSVDARDVLLLVAANGDVNVELLERLVEADDPEGVLAEAVEQDVLVIADGLVRFSHPLFASTVYGDASERQRSRVHLRLAELSETSEASARHLALAGTGPDETVATALTLAADSACRRGARSAAAALFEQAAGLTPESDWDGRARRLIAAARAHFQSGESDRARALLDEVARLDGAPRFEALCLLGLVLDETVGGDASLPAFEAVLETDDPRLRMEAHRCLAQSLAYVGDLEKALEHADAAVAEAERLPDGSRLVYALAMQALVRKIAGHPGWRDPLQRGLRLERKFELPDLDGCPSAFEADTLRLELDLDAAHSAYEALLLRTTERGDVRTECWCRFGLATVTIAAGRRDEATEHAAELADLAEQTGTLRLPALRTSAHLAVLRGEVDEARALIERGVSEAEPLGELHNLRSLEQLSGFLELSLGDAEAALPPLRRGREIAERMAVGEPSMLTPFLDEVEAHALLGDAASAAAVLMAFDRRCEGNRASWIGPLALRARGLVEAAARDLETACASLEAAVAAENVVPIPLERARTRLALGRVLRRAQRRSAAHAMLTDAAARFEKLDAPLWAERAREALTRIGGRAPSNDDLTPTEEQIAALVAGGQTNREVAAALFVTPKTVESALTRVYRKLGVRSRTELARRLGDAT